MLTDLLKDKLRALADDTLAITAIEALFAEVTEAMKPDVSDTADNNLLGEKFRAYESTLNILKKSFADLRSYKVGKTSDNKFNKED